MHPNSYEDDYLVIDASLDQSIFPKGISYGLNVLDPDLYIHGNHDDNEADFPEIDFEEFRDHI